MCSNCFEYEFPDRGRIIIIIGIPQTHEKYVAISYVWGDATPLSIACEQCKKITTFPMTSCSKFCRLMGLVGPGTRVWLDCLSINQDDHADIAKQVAVMGDIYTNACFVAVLLPEEDTIPFGLLKDVSNSAKLLLSREKYFARNSEDPEQLPINKMTDRKQRLRISDAGEIVLEDYNPPLWNHQWKGLQQAVCAMRSLEGLKNLRRSFLRGCTGVVLGHSKNGL
jgi:hypothetical protein